jgi:DNA gyrase subunit A
MTEEKIIPRRIEDEMKTSYLDYSMSVIVGRALPDVRDGLKPVHRRILYAMHDIGLPWNKSPKKSARVVGEVLGKYHPHGDVAVYDSMVRMVQDFSLRYPLIKGQGNFGSVDGDNAAAMRYTEVKLSKISTTLLSDIEKETVKFIPNFDTSLKEPTVLPAMLPNLLVNGSSGIAVGMATNIPPHNLTEVANAIIHLVDNSDADIFSLMDYVKGPDFPTAGTIIGKTGIKQAYTTGKGKILVRAKTRIEKVRNKSAIIVTELPYQVNKSTLLVNMAALVRDKKLKDISDLRDESDRDGMRIIIELKLNANSEIVLNQLYKQTTLQTTFGINTIALVNNVPKLLNLKQLLQNYIAHRIDVVTKRTKYDLRITEERAHILEGLNIALKNIDKTIALIKKSKSPDIANKSLQTIFKITLKQSQAILDMKLQRLTSLETDKITSELKEKLELIKKLKEILESKQKILNIIKKELKELIEIYGDERRTEISEVEEVEFNEEAFIKPQEVVVTMTNAGYIKRTSIDEYKGQKRGGKGVIAAKTREEDFIEDLFIANTHSSVLFFTNFGRVYWSKVYQFPESGRASKGLPIVNILGLQKEEKVTSFIPVKKFDDQNQVFMVTKNGIVKKTNLLAYSRPRKTGIIALTLQKGDSLIGVKLTNGNQHIILATINGKAVRFNESEVRSMGRTATGVKGIRLKDKDKVIGIVIAEDKKSIVTITENGYGKRTLISNYRLTHRATSGIINIKCSERNGRVAAINSVTDDDELMFISQKGITIRTPSNGISQIGRNTQGVRLMRLGKGDKVVSAAKIVG